MPVEKCITKYSYKKRKMLFIVRINLKLHSIIAKIMNIKLTIFSLDIMMTILTGVLNFSVRLPLSSWLKFLAKKLGVKLKKTLRNAPNHNFIIFIVFIVKLILKIFKRATWGPLGFMLLSFGWGVHDICIYLIYLRSLFHRSLSRITKRCNKACTYSAKDV